MISDDFGMIPVKLRLLRFCGQLCLFWETVEFVLDDHSMMLLSLGQQSPEGSKPGNCLAIWSCDGGTWLIVVGNVFCFPPFWTSNLQIHPPQNGKHFIHMGRFTTNHWEICAASIQRFPWDTHGSQEHPEVPPEDGSDEVQLLFSVPIEKVCK